MIKGKDTIVDPNDWRIKFKIWGRCCHCSGAFTFNVQKRLRKRYFDIDRGVGVKCPYCGTRLSANVTNSTPMTVSKNKKEV